MRISALVTIACLLVACQGGDAPIPTGYEALVGDARESLQSNMEGFVRPSLAFTRLDCYANGGVIVFFVQVGGQTPGELAFAMGGGGGEQGAWSGGFGKAGDIQEEIDFNFDRVPMIACPPRALA